MTDDAATGELKLHSPAEALAALTSPSLVPPPAPPTLGPGATADLRNAMARFSSGDEHRERRASVVAAVGRLEPDAVAAIARRETLALLDGAGDLVDAIGHIAFVAPTRALANALAPTLDATELDRAVADVATTVSAIGRGQRSSPITDAAVTRLAALFAPVDRTDLAGAVPPLSLLYQNHDATAALIAALLVAQHTEEPLRSPLAKTVRVATEATGILDRQIAAGQVVIVPIEAADLRFGAGQHECPGRRLAESIAEAVVAGIGEADYRIDGDGITYGDDGRATAIPLESLESVDEEDGGRS